MTQVQFYHLTSSPLERALPKLLEKAYSAGLKLHAVFPSEEFAEHMNELLWTYDPNIFLPHGSVKDANPDMQPIFIATDLSPRNAPNALLVTEGSVPPDAGAYERILDMFDGNNQEAVESARARWKQYKDAGHPVSYFRQTETGGWEKKA